MSYNIHHGQGTDGVFDYDRLAAVIAAHRPDLVALQEVDRGTTRAAGLDQAAELGRRTGMHQIYGAAMDYAGGQYGEAILSRWPILEATNHVMPRFEGSEPRALLVAQVRPPVGRAEIIFAGTHLAHDSAVDRLDQARRINDILPDSGLVILVGDLNATLDSAPMRELLEVGGWRDAFADDPRPTFPNVGPDRRIDWILVRGPVMIRIVSTEVIENEPASDHCAVLVEIEIHHASP